MKSGNHALRLETYFFAPLNRPAQGGATTADINIADESLSGGVPFNLRPSSLEGWYQYYPVGADTATMAILLSKWNPNLGIKDTVGYALFRPTNAVFEYTQFSAQLEYIMENDPDSMIVGFVCSGQFDPGIGSVMYIDDVSLSFEPLSVAFSEKQRPVLYPNPARDVIRFDVPEAVQLVVRNIAGQVLIMQNLTNGMHQLDVSSLPQGLFLFQFNDASGNHLVTSKVSVVR